MVFLNIGEKKLTNSCLLITRTTGAILTSRYTHFRYNLTFPVHSLPVQSYIPNTLMYGATLSSQSTHFRYNLTFSVHSLSVQSYLPSTLTSGVACPV